MEKMRENKNVIFMIGVIVIFICIKQYLLYNIPIVAHYTLGEDDALMVKLAQNLVDGKWLGEYKYNVLLKGPMFPMALSIISSVGISYVFSMTTLYTIACLCFLIAIKDRFKNKYFLVGVFGILLFNPIMYSVDVIQRVYRNALIPSLALMIVSSYLAIYIRIDKKIWYLLPWSIIASFSLSVFYYTREDSMWIIPFLAFMIVVTSVFLIIKMRESIIERIVKIILLILPIIVLNLTGNYIASKNEMFYGLKIKNTLQEGYFVEAIKAIYAVKPNEDIEHVTVTGEKVLRMANASPSFASITPALQKYMYAYGVIDRAPNDNEIDDGWFFWALRAAVGDNGIHSLEEEQQLYKNIADELNDAMNRGILERQRTMPSALMSPWRKGNASKLLKAFGESLKFVASFDTMEIKNTIECEYNAENYEEIKEFEKITNDRTIFPKEAVDQNGAQLKELEDQDEFIKLSNTNVSILNIFIKIYSFIGIILGVVGLLAYVKITVDMIISLKNKKMDVLSNWIITSGILGALVTLLLGISYNHISSCNSITYLYLAGAYPLYLAFTSVSSYYMFSNLSKTRQKSTKLLDK